MTTENKYKDAVEALQKLTKDLGIRCQPALLTALDLLELAAKLPPGEAERVLEHEIKSRHKCEHCAVEMGVLIWCPTCGTHRSSR